MNKKYVKEGLLLVMLILLSLLKDLITPDYLNTPNASFLNPQGLNGPAITTVLSHPIYWLLSLIYSLSFILLPYMICKMLFTEAQARLLFYILAILCVAEYIMVFSQSTTLTVHILPKINRYLHSPIPLLFFLAAFTLNQQKNGSD